MRRYTLPVTKATKEEPAGYPGAGKAMNDAANGTQGAGYHEMPNTIAVRRGGTARRMSETDATALGPATTHERMLPVLGRSRIMRCRPPVATLKRVPHPPSTVSATSATTNGAAATHTPNTANTNAAAAASREPAAPVAPAAAPVYALQPVDPETSSEGGGSYDSVHRSTTRKVSSGYPEVLPLSAHPPKSLPHIAPLEKPTPSVGELNMSSAGGLSYSPITLSGTSPTNHTFIQSSHHGSPVLTYDATIDNLNAYEEEEIKEYEPDVYFCGRPGCKKIAARRGGENNDGYDDELCHYKVVMGDHVAYRYEVTAELGKGTYGVVVKALDHKTMAEVAIKIIKNKPSYHKQAKAEVEVLTTLKEDDADDTANIVHLLDTAMFRNHLILVFELLGRNVYDICQNMKFQPMSPDYIVDFAMQLVPTLQFVRAHHIIHCDIKPENIVVCSERSRAYPGSSHRRIKLIDFGAACFDHKKVFTYIQSRFYRAPEIVLGIPYTTAIDMWSLGCVLCELANGAPLFPACCEGELLERMIECLGNVPSYLLEQGKRAHMFYTENWVLKPDINKKQRPRRKPGSRTIEGFLKSTDVASDKLFLDFVKRCLQYDPQRRLTPEAALEHPWIVNRFLAAR